MNSHIKQISRGGRNLLNCVISADILLGLEISVFICGVGVNKRSVTVNAVNCACKSTVALCGDHFCVLLCYLNCKLFEDIFECLSCGCVSSKSCCLISRNHIFYRNVFLADCVGYFLVITVVDGNIFKQSDTVLTCGNGIGFTISCDSEFSAAVLSVLRLLVDLN